MYWFCFDFFFFFSFFGLALVSRLDYLEKSFNFFFSLLFQCPYLYLEMLCSDSAQPKGLGKFCFADPLLTEPFEERRIPASL